LSSLTTIGAPPLPTLRIFFLSNTPTWPKVHDAMADIIGKDDKERTIPLLPAAIRAMGLPQDLGYVFWHPNDLDKYTKEFKKNARACGIEDLHLHNLRHTAATDMLASGMGIEYVQEVLGHADISTTQIYTKILQKNLRREMQKIRPTTQLKLVVFLRYLDIGHGVS